MGLFGRNLRTGQAPPKISRDEFHQRYMAQFVDSRFDSERDSIARLERIAYSNYEEGRKAPSTRKAGSEFNDPDYEISTEWLTARARLKSAQTRANDPSLPGRILVICGAHRNDGTCPGEMSKTFRLSRIIADAIRSEPNMDVDLLDLSLVTSEYGRTIHPCKGCVSTAMPLCHWPCSCYPNSSLNQVNDWMNEIYERWTLAHAVIIVAPVYWLQAPSALKLMMDRMVCADGGNPDPTSTHGKKATEAKAIEEKGWGYPQHLKGRAFGLLIHGDTDGAETTRRSLSDWLEAMGLVKAGQQSCVSRYVGYYEPYSTSHDALDKDDAIQEVARNVAHSVMNEVRLQRRGVPAPDAYLKRPQPK